MYNTRLLPTKNLLSVIDDRCDIKTAFEKTLNFFDPNKNKNRKTKILDCTYTYLWNENLYKRYDVTRTNNINGYALENKYPLIIYEPPHNNTFNVSVTNAVYKFKNLLYDDGIIIVKINDFKEKGKLILKGSYDLRQIFEINDFFLNDQIIYRYNKVMDHLDLNEKVEIVHSYFMIFKKLTSV